MNKSYMKKKKIRKNIENDFGIIIGAVWMRKN